MEVAETVAVMNHGRIEHVAGPVELYERPANEFVMELVRDGGEHLSAQLTREEAAALELAAGQIVYIRPTRQTTFTG